MHALFQDLQIEILLGLPVKVQWFATPDRGLIVFIPNGAVAIGRGGTGVNKTDIVFQRPLSQRTGVFQIILFKISRVLQRRRTAGAHVDDSFGPLFDLIPQDQVKKILFVVILPVFLVLEILLLDFIKFIDENQIFPAAFIKPCHDAASDKTGRAGDNDHLNDSSILSGADIPADIFPDVITQSRMIFFPR